MKNTAVLISLSIIALIGLFLKRKVTGIQSSFEALKFSVEAVRNFRFTLQRSTFSLDVLVRNPLNEAFNLVITEIALLNPSNSVIASTPTTGLQFSIRANAETRLQNIEITVENINLIRTILSVNLLDVKQTLSDCKVRINANIGNVALPTQLLPLTGKVE